MLGGVYPRRLPRLGRVPSPGTALLRHLLRPLVVHPATQARPGVRIRVVPPGPGAVAQNRPPHLNRVNPARWPPPSVGKVYQSRVFAPPPAPPPLPVSRHIALAARADNQVALRASVRTAMGLQASVQTSFTLKASGTMSISAKLTIFQGEDVTLTFSMTPPQDITGWTLTGTVKNYLGGSVNFYFTLTILDAGQGIFQAVWGRSNTSGLTPGDYVWDVRRTDTGNNTVLAHGELTSKQPVTP